MPVFYENSAKLASQWMKLLDESHDEVEIEITNWAARFALVSLSPLYSINPTPTS
jgi:hypothetical protein